MSKLPLHRRVPHGLSAFEAAALGIETESLGARAAAKSGMKGVSITGEQNAPAFEITQIFPYQSYFDSGLLEKAIMAQPPNEGIVPSTFDTINLSGYAVGLHPSSETPVAVRFKTGAQQGASPVFRLKPGQVIRPHGRPQGESSSGQFSGVEWGLPQGWLGGGAANLILFRTADATAHWGDQNEICFYRTRMPIFEPAEVPAAVDAAKNWPGRFPWAFARFGASTLNQRGRAALSLHPTRTLLRLKATSLPDPVAAGTNDVRILFFGADVLAMDGTGATDLTDVGFQDITWGGFTQVGAGLALQANPTMIITGQIERLNCNLGGIVMMAVTAAGPLTGMFIDLARFGRL